MMCTTARLLAIEQISVAAAMILDCVHPREVTLSSREPVFDWRKEEVILCGRSTRVEFTAISHANTRIKRFI